MHPKNKPKFDYLRITDWWEHYKGEGLKVANFESNDSGHGSGSFDILQQGLPNAEILDRPRPGLKIINGRMDTESYSKLKDFYLGLAGEGVNLVSMSLKGNDTPEEEELVDTILIANNIIPITSAGNLKISPAGTLDSWVAVGACILRSDGKIGQAVDTHLGEIAVFSNLYTSWGGVFTHTSSATPLATVTAGLFYQWFWETVGRKPNLSDFREFLKNNIYGEYNLFRLPEEIPQVKGKEPMPKKQEIKMIQPAQIINGRFMVPARDLVQFGLEGQADWNEYIKTGTFIFGKTKLIFKDGSDIMIKIEED